MLIGRSRSIRVYICIYVRKPGKQKKIACASMRVWVRACMYIYITVLSLRTVVRCVSLGLFARICKQWSYVNIYKDPSSLFSMLPT